MIHFGLLCSIVFTFLNNVLKKISLFILEFCTGHLTKHVLYIYLQTTCSHLFTNHLFTSVYNPLFQILFENLCICLCNKWKVVARPALKPFADRANTTTELPSHSIIPPTTLHIKPTLVTITNQLFMLVYEHRLTVLPKMTFSKCPFFNLTSKKPLWSS